MLSNRALLVHVSISQWTGRKLDRRATETVASAHQTNSQAGNYTKKLLPGSKELDRVSMIAGQIRKYFYSETLPWFSDGARIIKSESFMQFSKEFNKLRSQFEDATKEFLNVYPYLQAHAKQSLGSLYSPQDYPNVFSLQYKFKCDVSVMPMPDAQDFRTDIGDDALEEFKARMESVQREAMQDCWKRLHEVVIKAAEKLAMPDAIFKNSLLENVNEICALLPRLNVTDDPELERARMEVERTIAKYSPDVLRDNASERQDAAAKLAKITRAMGPFMGVK